MYLLHSWMLLVRYEYFVRIGNKLASFKKGTQYARYQNVENLGILIIKKTVVITWNFAAINSKYIFIVSTILKNTVQ